MTVDVLALNCSLHPSPKYVFCLNAGTGCYSKASGISVAVRLAALMSAPFYARVAFVAALSPFCPSPSGPPFSCVLSSRCDNFYFLMVTKTSWEQSWQTDCSSRLVYEQLL